MADQIAIVDHKATFLRSQIRLLSAPVKTSPGWHELAPPLEDATPLADKAVTEIVQKVNAKIKTHSRLVFPSQSQRHVAEQIDTLYWNEVLAEGLKTDAESTWVRRNLDLCETDNIKTLPEQYEQLFAQDGATTTDEDAAEYALLAKRLSELARTRDEKKHKLAQYRKFMELLAPFENPQQTIQPNLVTRDGDLSKELERTRVLVARIMSKISQIDPSSSTSANASDMNGKNISNEEKLSHVMDMG